jgi:hypothetical protein
VLKDSISTEELMEEIMTIRGMLEADDGEEEEEDEQGNIIPKEKQPVQLVDGPLIQSVDILSFIKT